MVSQALGTAGSIGVQKVACKLVFGGKMNVTAGNNAFIARMFGVAKVNLRFRS